MNTHNLNELHLPKYTDLNKPAVLICKIEPISIIKYPNIVKKIGIGESENTSDLYPGFPGYIYLDKNDNIVRFFLNHPTVVEMIVDHIFGHLSIGDKLTIDAPIKEYIDIQADDLLKKIKAVKNDIGSIGMQVKPGATVIRSTTIIFDLMEEIVEFVRRNHYEKN